MVLIYTNKTSTIVIARVLLRSRRINKNVFTQTVLVALIIEQVKLYNSVKFSCTLCNSYGIGHVINSYLYTLQYGIGLISGILVELCV